ncbi:MAG: hypothetical protein A2W19_01455 [Spirochaetes bacterium RBG_16_49_21]|nr:MAG: hypothetical protein A2W19_01455 [Spirochaetes bacterium RBG_16_49_21]
MNSENPFEKNRLRDRFKEMFILAAFTAAIAIISLLVMNLLTFPVTVFAVRHKIAFNFIFKFLVSAGIIILLVSLVLLTVFRLRKGGLSAKETARYMLRKPFYYLALFFAFVAVSAMVIVLLYVMLSNNYYFLYKLTNH